MVIKNRSREEHLKKCKEDAGILLDSYMPREAWETFKCGLKLHPETKDHPRVDVVDKTLPSNLGAVDTDAVRELIERFD